MYSTCIPYKYMNKHLNMQLTVSSLPEYRSLCSLMSNFMVFLISVINLMIVHESLNSTSAASPFKTVICKTFRSPGSVSKTETSVDLYSANCLSQIA